MKPFGCLLVALLSFGFSTAYVEAQENPAMPGMYDIPGFNPIREYGVDSFDTVDPYMGNLKIVNTDLQIPLNGEIDLQIQRNYQASQPGNVSPDAGAQGGGRSQLGVGWDIHFGRIWTTDLIPAFSSPTATGCRIGHGPANRYVFELPDGTKQVLYISIDSDKAYMTQQRWIAKCMTSSEAPEGGLVVYSPNGLKYIFNKRGYVKYAQLAYVVTRIEDRNGNYINFNYRLDNDTNANIRLLLIDYIDIGELGDHVRFTFEDPTFSGSSNVVGKNARLKYIDYAGRRVEYSYNDVTTIYGNGQGYIDGSKRYHLSQAKLPDGRVWKYEYVTALATDYRLPIKAVVSPFNGRYEYEYVKKNIPAIGAAGLGAATFSVVAKRALKNSAGTTVGQWQYQYGFSSTQDVADATNVITPSGCVQYKHMGNTSPAQLWRIGTLQEKTVFSSATCSGTALQKDVYTWDSQLISYDKQTINRPLRLSTQNTYLPRLIGTQITRDGTAYSKTFSSFDNYGNPGRVVSQQAGQAAKAVDYTYDVKTGPWIINLVDTEYYGIGSGANVDRAYNAAGNLLSETSFGKTTSFTYQNGEVLTKTDADSKVTSYAAYKTGIATSETRPEGVSVSRAVDNHGNITRETYNQLPSAQIPVGKSDGPLSVDYTYDAANRVKSIATPKNADSDITISYLYGTTNSRTLTRGSRKSVETYNNFGNKTSVSRKDISLAGASSEVIDTFSYDALGRVTHEYTPKFTGGTSVAKRYTYDALNRIKTSVNDADTSTVSYAYQAGNKVAVTDEAAKVTTYTYRAFDNPDDNELVNVAAPESQITEINRNILGQINYVKQGGITHSYGYDARMLLTSETRPEFGTITYGRDNRGNMTSRKVGASGTTTYSYDGLGRVTAINYPGTTPDITRIWYNKFGSPWQINRGSTDVTRWDYAYDENNNLTNETLTLSGSIVKALAVQRSYDALDQESGITYPSGAAVSTPRDALGRLLSLSHGGIGSVVSGITYRASGNLQQFAYGNGRATSVTETARLWPKRFTVSGGGVADFEYAYSKIGNVTGITDYVSTARTRTFGYDGLNRLTSVTGSGAWGNAALTYTVAGDIKTRTIGGVLSTLNYDTSNRLTSLVSGSTTKSYSYDNYGNVASKAGQAFFYDDAGSLIWDGTTAIPPNFAYDGHNRRYWQKDAAGTEALSVYSLNGQLLYQENRQSGVKSDYLYQGNALAARVDVPGGVTYYHTNLSGSPIAATSNTGALLWSSDYLPYGEKHGTTANTDSAKNKVWFGGHVQDAPSNLVYMEARYYDPEAGRFMAIDPVGFTEKNAQSFNRYAYANNNPYRFVDLDGKNAVTAFGGLLYESAQFVSGNGFNGQSLLGALADGYNGQGDGLASAAFQDATTFIPAGAVIGVAAKFSKAVGAAKETKWALGGFKSETKWANQLEKRGWTKEQITEAINKGEKFPAENLVNKGNEATRHVHPETGQSVVVDKVTNEVIHVGGPGFKY